MSHGWICHLMLQSLLHLAHCCFPQDCWMLLGIFQVRPWCCSCSAQQCPCPAARVPSSQRHQGHSHGCTRRAELKCRQLSWLVLALNGAETDLTHGTSFMASFFPEGIMFKKSSSGALWGSDTMQTDHSTTLQKPGWPQSVQSNKRWKWECCGRILGLYQLLGKKRFVFHLMSRTRLSLLITAM